MSWISAVIGGSAFVLFAPIGIPAVVVVSGVRALTNRCQKKTTRRSKEEFLAFLLVYFWPVVLACGICALPVVAYEYPRCRAQRKRDKRIQEQHEQEIEKLENAYAFVDNHELQGAVYDIYSILAHSLYPVGKSSDIIAQATSRLKDDGTAVTAAKTLGVDVDTIYNWISAAEGHWKVGRG